MTIRTIAAVSLMLLAIGCVVYAVTAWSDPRNALSAIMAGCALAVMAYRVDNPRLNVPERYSRHRRANGFSLVQLLVVLVIAAIIIGLAYPALTRAYRAATTQAVDEKLREVAVEKMYEQRGITADEIYAATAKAEWTRRGWAWPAVDPSDPTKPYYWTSQHVAAQLAVLFPDPNNQPDPPFQVPGRTSRQALIDQGLPEPEAKKELGMQ